MSVRGLQRVDLASRGRLASAWRHAAGRVALILVGAAATIFFTLFALDLARGQSVGEALRDASRGFCDVVVRLSRGDLGATTAGGATARRMPVTEVLAVVVPRSVGLLGAALAVATFGGVLIGLLAAISRRRLAASILLFLSVLGASAPSFFVALLLQILVLSLPRLGGRSVLPMGGFGWGPEIVLPALVLAARPLAQIARITYVKTREAFEQDYVRTAFGKGLGIVGVLRRHVARNLAIPVLTTVAISLRFALGSLPIVEVYFGWSGAGQTLLRAIASQDDNLTVFLLLTLAAFFLAVQLLLEATYSRWDPRVREPVSHPELDTWPSLRGFPAATARILRDLARRGREVLRRTPDWRHTVRVKLRERAEAATRKRDMGRRLPLWRSVNLSLLVGAALCLALVIVVLFGSRLAPHNPYQMAGVERVNGTLTGPPFAPSDRYPWGTDALGRDLMSLILVGAQQTLWLAAIAVSVRLGVGVVLGAVAGWWCGSRVDRAVRGLAQVITPFPVLLLAMLVILAVGIRQGTLPFVVGLCVVGWGELAQFVRSEVIAIRSRPFLESARAIGADPLRILAAHVMPHLVPSLLALAAIEFSAVLMILGELGFLGVFLGGGAYMELEMYQPAVHYSDVPEWGALLAGFRQAARAKPWLGIYPSLALLFSALGFHLLGEGIRREIERGRLFLKRLLNRKTLLALGAAGLVFALFAGNLGSAGLTRRYASEFSAEAALQHVTALTTPEMGGREIGSAGAVAAAEYIAAEFDRLGLQAIGRDGSYLVNDVGGIERLSDVPVLELGDGGPPLAYLEDFAEYSDQFRTLGEAEGQIRFVAFGESPTYGKLDVSPFKKLDLSKDVLLVLTRLDAELLERRRCAALLVVAGSAEILAHRAVLSPASRADFAFTGAGIETTGIDRPALWISEETAERILAGVGRSLAELRAAASEVDARDPLTFLLPCRAALRIEGAVEEEMPVRHVVGWIPGEKGNPREQMDNQVVAVLVQYDVTPYRPGQAGDGANDNASGVALLLEIARLLTQTEYVPNRSLMLVAYSGVGWSGGELRAEREAEWFLGRSVLPSRFFTFEAVVRLRGVGAGSTERLSVETSGGLRLANLFRSAASRMGGRLVIAETPVDLRAVYEGKSATESAEGVPEVTLSYENWALAEGPIDARSLGRSGRIAAFGVLTLGREERY
ncbi:MAG: ABC transporter permease subunit [Candidatus Bipolaricaulota bacterium]